MSPTSLRYVLHGFTRELDWKTLHFVKPLSPSHICCACGLVRKKTALLPCSHVLCEPCYEQCGHDGDHACPLDGQEYEEADVGLIECPADELLCREVKCWNEVNGCQYATAASNIIQHFVRECRHHAVVCPKCSDSVRGDSIIEHLKSGSCHPVAPPVSDSDVQAGLKDTTFKGQSNELGKSLGRIALEFSALGEQLKTIGGSINIFDETVVKDLVVKRKSDSLKTTVREIGASREKLEGSSTTYGSTIDDVLKSIDNLEGTLKGDLVETREILAQIAAAVGEFNAEMEKNSHKTLYCITSIYRNTQLQVGRCEFFVKDVSALGEEALRGAQAEFYGEKVYLRGYCMSPGLKFKKLDTYVAMIPCFRLHKGEMDDVVQWPFEHTVRPIIMHPAGGPERALEGKPHRSIGGNRKPTKASNEPGYFIESFNLEQITADGYVEDNRIRMKWELLP